MTANIHIKLNDGRSYVYGGVDTKHDLTFGAVLLFIGAENDQYKLDSVKEILIKPMPTVANSYESKTCPDCHEPIPKHAVDGAACSNCGHVFWSEPA